MSEFLSKLQQIRNQGKKALSVLVDPDQDPESVAKTAQLCQSTGVNFILVGGSLMTTGVLSETLLQIRKHYSGGIYLFPGNELMVDEQADGILLLSLLSGRNPEYLIGKHVVAAPYLAASSLDIIPTAYLLIDGGRESSVSYISNTKPIPADKSDIAMATALAGKLMGMQCIYLDAGSGALHHVPAQMLRRIRKEVALPLIVGGGIRQAAAARELYHAGADLLVIGNGVEENKDLIAAIAAVRNEAGMQVGV